ncbi:ABC transporter substrate-binding protein [Halosquirtibacter xylanolyticus]|uniref:ABC transporter substrate-binding protein n=1 Tax=Halosquirtibacter xylanolyticus TaxID=3374599 RepID=UPI0037495C76|nr:ABC transporter substrate-binding protein [Prolixibacteraceae bacterium]
MNRILLILSFIIVLVGCNERKNNTDKISFESGANKYAKGFTIDSSTLVVTSPWQDAEGFNLKYTILDNSDSTMKSASAFRLPTKINRIISFSTTHLAFLKALGEEEKIVGISGTQYVNDSTTAARIQRGEIQEIGYDNSLNEELIISLKPDVIFAYGVGSEVMELYDRFKKFNIPVVVIGEYNELHPLGKLEWIKVFGLLLDKSKLSNTIFEEKCKEYIKGVNLVKESSQTLPEVMTGFPYKDAWWVAGDKTTLAQFIRDAGGDYIWSDRDENKASPVSFEEVYVRSQKAQFWIDCGMMSSIQQILDTDPRFKSFRPLKEDHIFNNNLRTGASGGNDYWESGVMNPDKVLNDLIAIFHPTLLPNHEFYYYKKLK